MHKLIDVSAVSQPGPAALEGQFWRSFGTDNYTINGIVCANVWGCVHYLNALLIICTTTTFAFSKTQFNARAKKMI